MCEILTKVYDAAETQCFGSTGPIDERRNYDLNPQMMDQFVAQKLISKDTKLALEQIFDFQAQNMVDFISWNILNNNANRDNLDEIIVGYLDIYTQTKEHVESTLYAI